ncbi:hypothetical protein HPB47_013623 [Ixodes persulcatus]|uniref:Uncharacterized protein n=1 Tax=Ixodes persulcatus TaxID=34615 RepID=A0AC60QYB8_IXOPE|nr:hypothetical protein HPB47_013623 [Ixodes persulcatus]
MSFSGFPPQPPFLPAPGRPAVAWLKWLRMFETFLLASRTSNFTPEPSDMNVSGFYFRCRLLRTPPQPFLPLLPRKLQKTAASLFCMALSSYDQAKPGESIIEYFATLRELATRCSFTAVEDSSNFKRQSASAYANATSLVFPSAAIPAPRPRIAKFVVLLPLRFPSATRFALPGARSELLSLRSTWPFWLRLNKSQHSSALAVAHVDCHHSFDDDEVLRVLSAAGLVGQRGPSSVSLDDGRIWKASKLSKGPAGSSTLPPGGTWDPSAGTYGVTIPPRYRSLTLRRPLPRIQLPSSRRLTPSLLLGRIQMPSVQTSTPSQRHWWFRLSQQPSSKRFVLDLFSHQYVERRAPDHYGDHV